MTSKQYRKSSYVISAQVDTDKYVMLHGYSGAMDICIVMAIMDVMKSINALYTFKYLWNLINEVNDEI